MVEADWKDWNVRRGGYFNRAVRYFRAQGEDRCRAHQLAEDAAQDCCRLELEGQDDDLTGSLQFWRTWRAWRRSQVVEGVERSAEREAQTWHEALLRAVDYAEHVNERGDVIVVQTNGLPVVRCY